MKINRLKEVFKENGITSKKISIYLDVEKETVSRWVTNKIQPPISELYRISEYLRIDIKECFYPSDWSNSKIIPYKKESRNK